VLDKAAGFANADFCYGNPAINISFCPFTTDHQSFGVLAYNPQGRASSQVGSEWNIESSKETGMVVLSRAVRVALSAHPEYG
jgi:hypothetical protein